MIFVELLLPEVEIVIGRLVGGSVLSVIGGWVDPCTKYPLADELINWPIMYFAGGL